MSINNKNFVSKLLLRLFFLNHEYEHIMHKQGSCSHAKNWNILLSRNPFIIKMDTQKGNDVSIRVNHARMGRKTWNKQQYKSKRESCIEN